jgi:hypothetical protein
MEVIHETPWPSSSSSRRSNKRVDHFAMEVDQEEVSPRFSSNLVTIETALWARFFGPLPLLLLGVFGQKRGRDEE